LILKILIVNPQNPRVRFQRVKVPTSKPKPYLNISYISQIPMIMRPFIEDIVNVKGDGNCGFRVIARHM